jgi:hypothetical protein
MPQALARSRNSEREISERDMNHCFSKLTPDLVVAFRFVHTEINLGDCFCELEISDNYYINLVLINLLNKR